jgi:signal transduction histidine kinase
LRPLAVATVAVIVAVSLAQRPSPGLGGEGLAVTIALLTLVASTLAVLRAPDDSIVLLAPAAMILASSTLVWTQKEGPAMTGLFVAVSCAALRLPLARSLALLALAALTLAAASLHAHGSAELIVPVELGIVAFYLISSFARRVREAHRQTAGLLAELEASRRLGEEAAALRERGRIAREIHDVLAHSLSGLVLQLEGARMLAAQPNPNGELPAALDRAHHLARAGLQEARRAVGALRDEELPGADRLERLAADFTRDSQIETTLEVTGSPHRLDPQSSLTLFRVAQEALTNARKHAAPTSVELRLAYEPSGTRLVVEDRNGCPPQPARTVRTLALQRTGGAPGGYGLTGMRERAALLGGRLQAERTTDGFRVELWIPA